MDQAGAYIGAIKRVAAPTLLHLGVRGAGLWSPRMRPRSPFFTKSFGCHRPIGG